MIRFPVRQLAGSPRSCWHYLQHERGFSVPELFTCATIYRLWCLAVGARLADPLGRYVSVTMRRAHNAASTLHHRRLARNKLEPAASYGLTRVMWFGSRINETVNDRWNR